MKKIRSAYIAMLIITALFFLIPLLLKIPFITCMVSWIMGGFKLAEYKSAYLEVLGGIAGSWLAITGAIYTQRKFDEEKSAKEEHDKIVEIENRQNATIVMCRELLWNEIVANHFEICGQDNLKLLSIVAKNESWYLASQGKYRLGNWYLIRQAVIENHLECALKIMELYKYYEFLASYVGDAKEVEERSRIDFSKYWQVYDDVVTYLEIKED